jgi:hypothetical protein
MEFLTLEELSKFLKNKIKRNKSKKKKLKEKESKDDLLGSWFAVCSS